MIDIVKENLVEYVKSVLDDTVIRELKSIVMELYTNKNEVFKYTFESKEDAIAFLTEFDGEFDLSQFKSIFQHPTYE